MKSKPVIDLPVPLDKSTRFLFYFNATEFFVSFFFVNLTLSSPLPREKFRTVFSSSIPKIKRKFPPPKKKGSKLIFISRQRRDGKRRSLHFLKKMKKSVFQNLFRVRVLLALFLFCSKTPQYRNTEYIDYIMTN